MLSKICGFTRQEDLDTAARLGVQMCGFIFHSTSSRAVNAAQVAALKSGQMLRVGVFVEQNAEEICRIMQEARLDFAQLHGAQSIACALAVGPARVIRVIWPERYSHRAPLYAAVQAHAGACAYYLFDAGKSGGGSGKRMDMLDICGLHTAHPWILAGGLTAGNVRWAVAQYLPDGVDFNSGVEDAPGVKNAGKMAEAFAALQAADRAVR